MTEKKIKGKKTKTPKAKRAPKPASAPRPLAPSRLYAPCPAGALDFKTTASLKPLAGVIGQDRAVAAINFAVSMAHDGYNLFALGPEGTGKTSIVLEIVSAAAKKRPAPSDWCYVNNFENPNKPNAIRLKAGRAVKLRTDMDNLIIELRSAIPAVFESDEYVSRKEALEDELKKLNEEAFAQLQRRASERNVALIKTPMGMALGTIKDGEVLDAEGFGKLDEADKKTRKKALSELQEELEAIISDLPRWDMETREKIRALNRELTGRAVGHVINLLEKKWAAEPEVIDYFEQVRYDAIEHAAEFISSDGTVAGGVSTQAEASSFRRYKVNVMVDNSPQAGADACAPVVREAHPTMPNLLGRIEHVSQMGALVTDFNLIKPGALHRASGGYLLLDARQLLQQPFAWESLKRALRGRCIKIETPGESFGLVSTVSLEPEPIPLDVKIIMLGEPMLYYLLSQYDPDFGELFKVQADFAGRVERDGAAMLYARFIAGEVGREKLLHLDRAAVQRVVEEGARMTGNAAKLSIHMGSVTDLVREASHWAGQAGAKTVGKKHVQMAIDAKVHRSDRLRERIHEEINAGTIVVETSGMQTGQVNGLSVMQLDSFSFGRPSRISASVFMGKGEVVDIERQVELGGPLHSKGVLILEGFLAGRFGASMPLALGARIAFEQSYGAVDGDSASSAELYALLSAIGEIPLKQSLAVTGSVDQMGRVQAVGGVNEKIEGFFDICSHAGLDGSHGVIIPAANQRHLMLRADVVAAAKKGLFNVWAVETIDQGIELLSGIPAGRPGRDGGYPLNTFNRAVERRLRHFIDEARAFTQQTVRPANAIIKVEPAHRD